MRDQTKSFEYTLQVMNNLEQQARDEIARLGGNPYLTKIVDALKVSAWFCGGAPRL
jgi:geranylgeranyl diphosphate synthase, type III